MYETKITLTYMHVAVLPHVWIKVTLFSKKFRRWLKYLLYLYTKSFERSSLGVILNEIRNEMELIKLKSELVSIKIGCETGKSKKKNEFLGYISPINRNKRECFARRMNSRNIRQYKNITR